MGQAAGAQVLLAGRHPHEAHRHADHQGRRRQRRGGHQPQQFLQGRGRTADQHHRRRHTHKDARIGVDVECAPVQPQDEIAEAVARIAEHAQ